MSKTANPQTRVSQNTPGRVGGETQVAGRVAGTSGTGGVGGGCRGMCGLTVRIGPIPAVTEVGLGRRGTCHPAVDATASAPARTPPEGPDPGTAMDDGMGTDGSGRMVGNGTAKIGFWSAAAASMLVAVFAVLLVAGFWLPTQMASYTVCFLLAPTFLAVMISIHAHHRVGTGVWSQLALSFAVVYVTLITISYYTQLTVVRINPLELPGDILQALTYTPGSLIFSLNMLGYGFMCLALLSSAPVFGGTGLSLWVRRLLVVNGVFFAPTWLFPALPFQPTGTEADVFGTAALLLWCVLFIPLASVTALYFRDQIRFPVTAGETGSLGSPGQAVETAHSTELDH